MTSSQSQCGFHSNHSTVIALLEGTDSWAFGIDRGNVDAVVLVLLHGITVLVKCLRNSRKCLQLVQSYLENRTQISSVSGSLSKTCSLQCGIPQVNHIGSFTDFVAHKRPTNCLSNSCP